MARTQTDWNLGTKFARRINSLPAEIFMDSVTRPADELQLLRALCDEAASDGQRLAILRSLEGHVFIDSENQVVFESICFLFPRGGVTATRLTVHLNNRGFPDVDIHKYFLAGPAHDALKKSTDKENT